VEVGESAVPEGVDVGELAAWTLICSSLLNLDSVICRN
jgi:hypothetical protein